jgi:aminomethyltransferase
MTGVYPEATTLRRTALYERHVALGAKMVPFAGYEMPLAYPPGMTAEHHAVRGRCGVFDVSHMGEVMVTGPDAVAFVDFVTSNDVRRLTPGQVQYSTILTEQGTIVDDCLVYRIGDAHADRVMVVINASNHDKDLEHIRHYASAFDCAIEDISDQTALIAVQGPASGGIVKTLTAAPLDDVLYYHFTHALVAGVHVLVSRTGYTGEDGLELYFDASHATAVWDALLATEGAAPAGLGARDSLRLEAGLPLYGNDIDDSVTPIEAGLAWVAKLDKPRFVGRDALVAQKAQGPTRRLMGFRVDERAVPRHGYAVLADGATIDCVRSGIMSPTLGYGVGTTYVPIARATAGARLEIDVRGRRVPATTVSMPFYRTSHPPKRKSS